eukprot:2256172-Rhodomonas_salina.3
MSGTGIASGAIFLAPYVPAMPCPIMTQRILIPSCAVGHHSVLLGDPEICYNYAVFQVQSAIRLRDCYAMPSTD